MSIDKENRPLCKCHSVPMNKGGGGFVCAIKHRKRQSIYRTSPQGLKKQRERRQTPRGYVVMRRYELKKRRERIVNQLKELENVK